MDTFAREILELRPMLVGIARQRLRNDAWAEDAVSEALVAALERPAAFEGRAALGTWLVGILKHKIADQVRRHTRECQAQSYDDDGNDPLEEVAAADRWSDPQAQVSQREFMDEFHRCLRTLPQRQGHAFMLRNWVGAATEEICNELGVTENHLGVMLHRARRRLRAALAPHAPAGMAA
jgi:RNA polymerase sigma-70 factor (ECF subfamily)